MILAIILGFFLFAVLLGGSLGWYVRGAYPSRADKKNVAESEGCNAELD